MTNLWLKLTSRYIFRLVTVPFSLIKPEAERTSLKRVFKLKLPIYSLSMTHHKLGIFTLDSMTLLGTWGHSEYCIGNIQYLLTQSLYILNR